MAVKIRLKRMGATKRPYYRLVVADSRAKRDGNVIESIGTYMPLEAEKYNVNDKVTILYNPNKTDQFIVKGDNSNNLFMFIFGIAGLFITGYGIYLLIKKDNEAVTVE